MVFSDIKNKNYPSDDVFDLIYPRAYRIHSERHFTPVNIAVKAAQLLVDSSDDYILDIGSGVGKFCSIGVSITKANFYGVEKRKKLINVSNKIKQQFKLKNAHFLHKDFTELDFKKYNGIYFFNSFHEYFDETCILDTASKVSLKVYRKYHDDLIIKLDECNAGTKLVTYHTFKNRIPSTFRFIDSNANGLLKFYIKK